MAKKQKGISPDGTELLDFSSNPFPTYYRHQDGDKQIKMRGHVDQDDTEITIVLPRVSGSLAIVGDGGTIDLSDYYTKSEVESLINDLDVELKNDYYNKEEIDKMLADLNGSTDGLQAQLDALEVLITQNANDISDNSMSISINESAINDNKDKIKENESAIKLNADGINKNKKDIDDLKAQINAGKDKASQYVWKEPSNYERPPEEGCLYAGNGINFVDEIKLTEYLYMAKIDDDVVFHNLDAIQKGDVIESDLGGDHPAHGVFEVDSVEMVDDSYAKIKVITIRSAGNWSDQDRTSGVDSWSISFMLGLEVEASNYYSKSETDTLLDTKADKENTYTKAEVDDSQALQDTEIAKKADKTNVYTKAEIDTQQSAQDTKIDKNIDDIQTNADAIANLPEPVDAYTKAEVDASQSAQDTKINKNTSDISKNTTDIESLGKELDSLTGSIIYKGSLNATVTPAPEDANVGDMWINEYNVAEPATNYPVASGWTPVTEVKYDDKLIKTDAGWDKVESVVGVPTYTAGEIDDLLDDKADKDAVYTKDEANTLLDNKANVGDSYLKTETYNNVEVDTKLFEKADKATTYTKTETNTLLDKKANVGDSYLKAETYSNTQIDTKLADKASLSQDNTLNGKQVFNKNLTLKGAETAIIPTLSSRWHKFSVNPPKNEDGTNNTSDGYGVNFFIDAGNTFKNKFQISNRKGVIFEARGGEYPEGQLYKSWSYTGEQTKDNNIATVKYVNTAISDIEVPEPDLSNYMTTDETVDFVDAMDRVALTTAKAEAMTADRNYAVPLNGNTVKTGSLTLQTDATNPFTIYGADDKPIYVFWKSGAVAVEKPYNNFQSNELVTRAYVDSRMSRSVAPDNRIKELEARLEALEKKLK